MDGARRSRAVHSRHLLTIILTDLLRRPDLIPFAALAFTTVLGGAHRIFSSAAVACSCAFHTFPCIFNEYAADLSRSPMDAGGSCRTHAEPARAGLCAGRTGGSPPSLKPAVAFSTICLRSQVFFPRHPDRARAAPPTPGKTRRPCGGGGVCSPPDPTRNLFWSRLICVAFTLGYTLVEGQDLTVRDPRFP